MKNPFKRKEFAIGLSVIVALFILVFGINYLKGINIFTPANFYYAEYDNVSDLSMSAPVTIDGYQVGKVRDITFDYDHPGKLKVTFAVDKKLRVPVDSRATIENTLLSGAFINLHLGTSDKMLEHGARIESGSAPGLMDALQSEVLPSIGSVMHKVDSLLVSLNTLVADPALAQTISRLDGISNNILIASQGLNSTLNKDVPQIMRSAKGSLTRIDTICANLAVLSATLKNLPLDQTMASVNKTTDNLARFSTNLNNPNSTLTQLTTEAELYDRINRVAADIDSLIVDIKKNPKRYISIKLL